jgi:hypothetical protein
VTKRGLNNRIVRLQELKQERDAIDAEIKAMQQEVIDALDDLNEKSISVDIEGRQVKATKVEPVRTTIDENSLKRALGEKAWMKVSTRILDKKKLEAYIATGEVDAMVVAECTTENPSSPYIKIT